MSDSSEAKARELYEQALERPESARGKFLDRVCGGGELRARVEALLKAHKNVGEFLAQPTGGSGAHASVREQAGDVIGRYKLLQEIGEGGFGVVYMAQQQEPVRRKVALKIIKMGMDTEQVIARFEAERQALAIMDHANIAKVLDAGATETGRPYFVMELVRGIPITQYCDQVKLPAADRIALFQDVCHAVQHAHHKGIIHRDIKPSNILVTLHDDRPVPKVIDFGIAKATDHQLTQKTVFTQFRQMIGTPEYMAPEQAGISGLDVDTRADVYSLGVVLYELLTGSKPFDLATLLEQGYDEVLRTIREVEPQKPSTRSEQLDAVAQHRHVPARFLRGDLDWIVLKALEKDRMRRYETPDALAMDLQRFLRDEPVLATPPSAGYRFRKYVKRHRAGVVMAAAVFLALIAGGALAVAGYLEARTQEREARRQATAAEQAAVTANREAAAAEAARQRESEQRQRAEKSEAAAAAEAAQTNAVVDLLFEMLGAASPDASKSPDYTVRELLEEFDKGLDGKLKDQPEVEATIRLILGQTYMSLSLVEKGERHLKRSLELTTRLYGTESLARANGLSSLAWACTDRGEYRAARRLYEEALRVRAALGQTTDSRSVSDQASLALVMFRLGETERARTLCMEVTRALPTLPARHHSIVARAMGILGMIRRDAGYLDDALKLNTRAMELFRSAGLIDHPDLVGHLQGTAFLLWKKGRLEEAEAKSREAVALALRLFGSDHAKSANAIDLLGVILREKGDYAGSMECHKKALEVLRTTYGGRSHVLASCLNNLGHAQTAAGLKADALTSYREAVKIISGQAGPRTADYALLLMSLAGALSRIGETDEPERLAREALAIRTRLLGSDSLPVAQSQRSLAVILWGRNKLDEAEPLMRKALATLRNSLGDEHPDVLRQRSDIGHLLMSRGDFQNAERVIIGCLKSTRKVLGPNHPEVGFCLRVIAQLAYYQNRLDVAEARLAESTKVLRQRLPADHRQLSVVQKRMLAYIRIAQGNLEDAESLFRDTVARERSDDSLATLGDCLVRRGKFDEAERVLRECVRMREESSPGHWVLYNAKSLLGAALAGQKKFAEAEPLLLEGYEKLDPPAGRTDRRAEALQRIVQLYEAWGKPKRAAEWRAKLEPDAKPK